MGVEVVLDEAQRLDESFAEEAWTRRRATKMTADTRKITEEVLNGKWGHGPWTRKTFENSTAKSSSKRSTPWAVRAANARSPEWCAPSPSTEAAS